MILLLAACPAVDRLPLFGDSGIELCSSPRTETVSAVVDGDTLDLETGERIRLLGVDTPEVHGTDPADCYGVEASNALKALLPVGSEIQLSFDVECVDSTDSARTLAYVQTVPEEADTALAEPEESVFVNEYLLEEGFARLPENCDFIAGLVHEDTLRRAAQRAADNGTGLRGVCETQAECD